MNRLSALLFIFLVACALLLMAAAVSCTPTQGSIFAGAVTNLNQRIDSAYVTASEIAFTGKVVDANGMWLDGYLVILYLNGKEIGRGISQLQKFPESEIGVYNGLFKIEAANAYELSAADHFVLTGGQTMTMSSSQGFVGNTATVYKWFGDLQPGTLIRIRVPSKQVEYALYVSPTAFSTLDAEFHHGKTELTVTGEVIPYVYADGVASATATPTSVPDRNVQTPQARAGQISWSYSLTGFDGNRWEVWEQYIVGRVPGISWEEFKEQVLIHNPHLMQDSFIFYPGKSYVLPEVK